MTAMEKFNVVKRACDERKVCQLHFREEQLPRLIYPLGVCLTFNRGMVIVCCEVGSSSAEKGEVINLPMEDCDHIHVTETKFQAWPEFKRKMKICDDWLFHISATS